MESGGVTPHVVFNKYVLPWDMQCCNQKRAGLAPHGYAHVHMPSHVLRDQGVLEGAAFSNAATPDWLKQGRTFRVAFYHAGDM